MCKFCTHHPTWCDQRKISTLPNAIDRGSKTQRAAPGRDRINVLGALDAISLQVYSVIKIFHQAIVQTMTDINHCPVRKNDPKSLLTLNFQSFAQNLTP